MDAERWRKVEALYHSALGREPGERADYLFAACQGDNKLQQEVESLLAQNVSASGVLDHPAWEGADSLLKSLFRKHSTLSTTADPDATDATEAGEVDPPPARGRRHPFIWVV